ncbi:MAG: S41 family peptidase [Sedimentisphaerales bacterium]
MRKRHYIGRTRHVSRVLVLPTALLVVLGLVGCSCAPRLTAEDRRSDIEFLARWAKDYSPFVEMNEKCKGLPSYEALAPRYMQLAEEAESNAAFYQVAYSYFSLIGVSGHGHLLSEESLQAYLLESLRQRGQLPWYQLHAASYWPKLQDKVCFVHPPFRVVRDGQEYRTGEDWRHKEQLIPKGSKIVRVNGMECSSYIERLRRDTWVRYIPRDTDWIADSLLAVHEGTGFRGWQVAFLLSDQTTCDAFVPWRKGFADPAEFSDYGSKGGNCICLELAPEVGYIRVKCMGGVFVEGDGKKIRKFLEDSGGKYRKLIIDVRHNGGGLHYYSFDNLIAPFLDESVTYSEVGGIRKPFLADHEPPLLELLRRGVSIFAHETLVEEIEPPEGFDETQWVFYKITRRVDPRQRYDFRGQMYILLDRGTGSAADEYVNAAQRIGLATLAGQSTPGSCGPYFNPVMVRLPASGMIFVLEADLMLNQDGSVNEIVGTRPDMELAPSPLPEKVTKEELLHDEWVRKIIAEP